MDAKRIFTTTLCCGLSGLQFLFLIKWDWSYLIIPIMMSLSVSLTNRDLIVIRKKPIAIVLHTGLSVALFFFTIGATFGLFQWIDHFIVFYLGCVLGAVLFALATNIILPFRKFWPGLLTLIVLSLLVFPIATYIHETPRITIPILKNRDNIALVWMTLVGLGTALGIHWKI